jgi:hypothetical protein
VPDLIQRIRYWLLKKLDGVDREHHEFLVDNYKNLYEKVAYENGCNFRQLSSIHRAYNDLTGTTFYSWQRDYQILARHYLGMPEDASVEDIRLALSLRQKTVETGEAQGA